MLDVAVRCVHIPIARVVGNARTGDGGAHTNDPSEEFFDAGLWQGSGNREFERLADHGLHCLANAPARRCHRGGDAVGEGFDIHIGEVFGWQHKGYAGG